MSILSVDTIQPIGSGSTVTLNAAKIVVGTGITFESNGQAIYAGIITATSFSGSGANLTSLPAANLTGTLPAISGANLTSLPAQATIANNADNRVITGGSGVNLNGEANFSYDGTRCLIGTNTAAPYVNRNLTVAQGSSGNTTVAIEVRSPTNGDGRLIFSDGTTADAAANQGQVIYDHPNARLQLGVAANYQNVTVESTGGTGADLHIIDGNLKVASGHGIDFSASGNAGGMTSELLDDYEEGSFTPTLKNFNGSYTSQIGRYTKVGNMVHYNVFVKINVAGDTGSPTGINMPFDNGSGMTVIGQLVGNESWDTNLSESNLTTWMPNGSNEARFYKNSGLNLNGIRINDIGNSGEIAIAGSYRVS